MQPNLKGAQNALGYKFKDKNFLMQALTHSSYSYENTEWMGSNERMEFLGDAVLGIVISDYLYKKHIDIDEGELTKRRSVLVCEKSLATFAKKISLGEFLILGKGELANKGHEKASILADAFEAVLGAIYLDGGINQARKFLFKIISSTSIQPAEDYKTTLQEIVQQQQNKTIRYNFIKQSGPMHDRTFTYEVTINNKSMGRGIAKSKKNAQQNAAKEALSKLTQPN